MFESLALSPSEVMFLMAVAFVAGVVRGFSGFALSAMVMSISVLILPPVALIPICWVLEMTASALMVRGGWAEADRGVAFGLTFGNLLGLPLGLLVTQFLPEDSSRLAALILIIALAALQLARVRMAFLATKPGLYGAGIVAGFASGIASVGGMVVALYVLSQEAPARQMRATLVLFLLLGSALSVVWLVTMGVFDVRALLRGLALALPVACGVIVGKALFNPRFEPYYKPVCLVLLVGLAVLSLIRTLI